MEFVVKVISELSNVIFDDSLNFPSLGLGDASRISPSENRKYFCSFFFHSGKIK
jgi:hypothetical protein